MTERSRVRRTPSLLQATLSKLLTYCVPPARGQTDPKNVCCIRPKCINLQKWPLLRADKYFKAPTFESLGPRASCIVQSLHAQAVFTPPVYTVYLPVVYADIEVLKYKVYYRMIIH